jgi:hypothetical protein
MVNPQSPHISGVSQLTTRRWFFLIGSQTVGAVVEAPPKATQARRS